MSGRLDIRAVLLGALLPFLTSAAASAIPVGGIVYAPDGGPLAGARVELLAQPGNFETNQRILAGEVSREPAASTRADALGRFLLEAPEAGVWKVVARAEGFAPMQYAPLAVVNPVELPPVSLTRDARAAVEVRNVSGAPAAEVWVYAVSATPGIWRERAAEGWRPASRMGRTDTSGRLTLARAHGERLDISVFPPGSAVPRNARETDGARIVLPQQRSPGTTVMVRDPRGEPVEGVLVCVGELAWPAGATGRDGTLRLGGGIDGAVRLHILAADGRRWSGALHPGDQGTSVVFPDAVRLAGRVVAEAGREPVSGALVWSGLDPGAFVRSDGEGRYEIPAPAEERPWLEGEASGFLPRRVTIEKEDLAARQVPQLALVPPAAVDGRVVDAQGMPVPAVRLAAMPRSAAASFDPGRAVSDAEGRFRVGRLQPGTPYELKAEKRGFVPGSVTVEGLAPAKVREAVRIVLDRMRSPFGRVVDPQEKPIAGVEVLLRPAGKPQRVSRKDQRDPDEDALFTAMTDAAGRFELAEPPAPQVDVIARKEGFAPLTVRAVPIPPGEGPADLGTLVLEPSAALVGVVTDRDGRGVEGVSVWAVEENLGRSATVALGRLAGREPAAVTGKGGSFALEDLVPRREVFLYFQGRGYLPASLPGVQPPTAEPVRVTLQPAARLAGRVVDEEGSGVPGAEVSIHPRETRLAEMTLPRTEEHLAAHTDERGEFAIEGVPPGLYEADAFAAGFQPSDSQAVQVTAGGEVEGLRLVLRRGAVLEGRVVTASGEPVAGARVLVGRPVAASGPDGRYRVEGVTPGPQTAEARHPSYNRVSREVEIQPGTNTLDFTLPEGHLVAGRIVDESGEPVSDVLVTLRLTGSRDSREHRITTGPDGDFRIQGVMDGDYQVIAEKEGYATAEPAAGLRVAGAPVEGIEIRIQGGVTLSGRIHGLSFRELNEVQVRAESGQGRPRDGSVDYQGSYRIADLGPGDWTVRAWLRNGSRQTETRLAIAPGARQVRRDLDFGGVTLTGQVLYGGSPLVQAQVAIDGQDVTADRVVATDYQGRFRAEDLSPGRYRLGVTHPAELVVHNEELELTGSRDIVLEIATGRVTGRVLAAPREEPVAGATVSLRQLLGTDGSREGSLFSVPTDAAGSFGIPRVTQGRYRAIVRKEGYATVERDLEVTAGGLDGLRFLLTPTAGLDLLVRIDGGRPPGFATVSAVDPSGRIFLTERQPAGAGGRVRLTTLPPGSWTLLVSAPGAAVTSVAASVPGDPVSVTLPAAAPLRVRVPALLESGLAASLTILGRDGQPLQAIDPASGLPAREWRIAGGAATVEGIPAGLWTLRVMTADGQTLLREVATSGQAETRVDLE